MFAALGAHADATATATATGTAEGARRRGEQRRRNRIAAASLALVFLVSVVTVGGIRIARHATSPAQPSPDPSGSLATLSPVGSLLMPLGSQQGGSGTAVLVGDRAYLAGYTAGGGVKVGSMDLATGELVFATVDLHTWTIALAFWASPRGLALIVGRDGEAGRTLVVLDPDTGAIRWQTGTETPLAFYDSVLVTFSTSELVVRARDWMTGEEKWQARYAGEYPNYVQLSADPLTGGLRLAGGFTVDPADHRLLRIDADGSVHLIDPRTGAELAVREGVGDLVPNETANLAFESTLYRFDQETPGRVIRHDLDRVESPTEVYSSTTGRIEYLAPCGAGRLCLLVSHQDGTGELIVLDDARRRELWRAPVSSAVGAIQSVRDRILVGSGDLFDMDGHRLSVGPERGFRVLLTADIALTLRRLGPDPLASAVAVGTMSTVDGSTRQLGQIPPLAGLCDWNPRVLVCPAADGFHAWMLAAQ